MKCENCRFLRTEGYEYPETYCGAGVADDDERLTSDGCSYHYKTLLKMERERDKAWNEAYTISEEDYNIFFRENEEQKIIDFIGEDIFYGIEDDIIQFENIKKENLEEELYHKE